MKPTNLVYVSASQISTFLGCKKAWAYDKLDRLPRPERVSAAEGTKIHAEVEAFYRDGTAPVRPEALALLQHLPDRGTRPSVESAFMYLWPTVPRAVVRGYIDLRLPGQIFDHKTVFDIKADRMLTSETLPTNPQAVIYGRAERLRSKLPDDVDVELQWTYTRRLSNRHTTPKSVPVKARQSLRILEQAEADLTPTVQALVDAVDAGMKAKDFTGDTSYCFKYGKCAYYEACFAKSEPLQEQTPMSEDLLAQLRALSAQPPTAPSPTPAPAPEPTNAAPDRPDPVLPPMPSDGIDFAALSSVLPPDAAPDVSPFDPPVPELVAVKRGRGRPKKAETPPSIPAISDMTTPETYPTSAPFSDDAEAATGLATAIVSKSVTGRDLLEAASEKLLHEKQYSAAAKVLKVLASLGDA